MTSLFSLIFSCHVTAAVALHCCILHGMSFPEHVSGFLFLILKLQKKKKRDKKDNMIKKDISSLTFWRLAQGFCVVPNAALSAVHGKPSQTSRRWWPAIDCLRQRFEKAEPPCHGSGCKRQTTWQAGVLQHSERQRHDDYGSVRPHGDMLPTL